MIHIVQHHAAEGPGAIQRWLLQRALTSKIYRMDFDDALPEQSADPIVLLGGPFSVNAPPPFLLRERDWLVNCLQRGAPVFAICMGAQLLAQQLGAQVGALTAMEHSWCPIWFRGQALEVLQWHEEGFSLPTDAQTIAHNALYACQGFSTVRHCALQFHAEWTPEIIAALNADFGVASPLRELSAVDARFATMHAALYACLDDWWNAAVNHSRVERSV